MGSKLMEVGLMALLLGGCPPDYDERYSGACFNRGEMHQLTLEVVARVEPPDSGVIDRDAALARGLNATPPCLSADIRNGDTFSLEVAKQKNSNCARLECPKDYLARGPVFGLNDGTYYLLRPYDSHESISCRLPARITDLTNDGQCQAVRGVEVTLVQTPSDPDGGVVGLGTHGFLLTRSMTTTANPRLRCDDPQRLTASERVMAHDKVVAWTANLKLDVELDRKIVARASSRPVAQKGACIADSKEDRTLDPRDSRPSSPT